MKAQRRRCAGTNLNGNPCGNPVVGAAGYCAAHGKGGKARMRELGLRGALRSRGAPGLDKDRLGPLETHDDAKRWLEEMGRAVVTGRLRDRDAQAGIRAVEAWLKAEGERATAEVVNELRVEIDRVKRDMTSRREASV